jgi:hypothetical protein
LKHLFRGSDGVERTCVFTWGRGRLFSEYEALIFYEMCMGDGGDAKVKKV